MFLSRVILFLGLCWVVECDLLDLYVQHMDETMKTIVYQKTHVKNLARGRNKRDVPTPDHVADEETFYKFGNFKKQKLEVDEGWSPEETGDKAQGKEPEKIFIEKNDGLDFKNDREENLDPEHYEILANRTTDESQIPVEPDEDLQSEEKLKGKGKKVLLKKDDGLEAENAAEEGEVPNVDAELIDQLQNETLEFLPELESGSDSIANDSVPEYDEAVNMDEEEVTTSEPESNSIMSNTAIELEETESAITEDVDLDVELVSESEDDVTEKSGWNPSLKRNPTTIGGRVPKKYTPTEKDVRYRQKVTNKESTTTTTTTRNFTLTANTTRTKRSAKKPRFSRREELDDDGHVVLEWDPTDEEIVTFRVTAKTLGYVGIGFNDKSHMKGADILLAWIDNHNGNVNLLDSHGIEERNAAPVTDVSQDVEVLGGIQNETHTTVTFSRRWHTCDPQDRQLTEDTIHVLWALHETDPELNTAAGHGERRGGRPLRLKAPAPHPPPITTTSDVRPWDIKLNRYTVSNKQDTVYWCKIFKAPPLNEKHHMIGYKPRVENKALVHHIILYECASVAPILGDHARLAGAPCYSPTMPREWDSCLQPVVAWARGSKGEWFPEHIGIPIAEHREGSYYMLEVHYNNPELKEVVDSSGITLYLTPKLRPQEAGILITGVAVSPLHMIPPRQKEYATAGYCTPHCTKQMFPEDGINIVSVVLHSHLAGRRLGLKHIRQGKELPKIVQDNHFDFNYQQSHTLEKEVKVLPGDELVAECVYRTLDRAHPTLGGYAATQEMCLAFMLHYPRTPLAACYSMTPVKDLFRTLGVHSFQGVTIDHLEKLFLTIGTDTVTLPTIIQNQPVYPAARPVGEIDEEIIKQTETALKAINIDEYDDDNVFARLVIETPEEFRGRTLAEHMLAMPWTEELLAKSIEQNLYHGRHMTFCRKRDDKLAVPADIQMFPNFTALPEVNKTTCDALKIVSSSSVLSASLILNALVVSIFHWRLLLRL